MQAEMAIWLVTGVLAGGAIGWIIARGRDAAARSVLEERLASRQKELQAAGEALREHEAVLRQETAAAAELRQTVAKLEAQIDAARESAKQRAEDESVLRNAFASLAAEALQKNNRAFVDFAKEKFVQQQSEAKRDLEARETAIDTLLQPVRESLEKLETHSREMEKSRAGAYEGMLAEIRNMQSVHTDLRKETSQLVAALRAPKARGNWGELQLKRCVEFAGMVQHASFEVEQFVRDEDASYRPDLVVKMPNGRTIIVDAKTPLDAFLEASVCEDEVKRASYLAAHAERVRQHLDQLAGKVYWKQFVDSPDFVVCFLPSEVLFSAALEQNPALIEYSANKSVILATPTTLIALLKAVAFGWQQSQVAKDAEKIRDAAIRVQDKLAGMHSAMLTLGNQLRKAGQAYDDMLIKAEGQGGLFSIARRLRALKVGERDLPESKPAAIELRPMSSEDWQGQLSLVASADEGRIDDTTETDEALDEITEELRH